MNLNYWPSSPTTANFYSTRLTMPKTWEMRIHLRMLILQNTLRLSSIIFLMVNLRESWKYSLRISYGYIFSFYYLDCSRFLGSYYSHFGASWLPFDRFPLFYYFAFGLAICSHISVRNSYLGQLGRYSWMTGVRQYLFSRQNISTMNTRPILIALS